MLAPKLTAAPLRAPPRGSVRLGAARRRTARARGFTLIELLVALTIMAVLAGLAWTGIDSLIRTRESTQAALDRTQRLATVLTQWEQDLAAIHESVATPPLQYDGRTLRLTRTAEGGVRVVTWTLRDGAWYRWTGPVVQRAGELQQSWLGSQQHQGGEPGELQVVADASAWQLYYYRGNAWTNAQSSGNVRAPAPPASGAAPGTGNPALDNRDDLPDAVRLVLTLPGGTLTRDILMPPHPT
jgi:general secretion pathway protein J